MSENSWSLPSSRPIVKFVYLSVTATFLIGFWILFPWMAHSKVFSNSTEALPPPFTELYFSGPTSLPTTATEGQKLTEPFVIHNLETKDMIYGYQISIAYAQGPTYILARSELPILNNNSAKVNGSIVIPENAGRAEVNIQLVSLPESIHYWINVQE